MVRHGEEIEMGGEATPNIIYDPHRFPQPNIGIKKMSQETVSGTI